VQAIKHGALALTSCFARESYLGNSLRWCHGKKYILEQFITWYIIDRSLRRTNKMNIDDLFYSEQFDERYLNKSFIPMHQDKLSLCLQRKNIDPNTKIIYYARYRRGIKSFHSRAYSRSGNAISYMVSISTHKCPAKRQTCFAEILFYLNIHGVYYALIPKHDCVDSSISSGLSITTVPPQLVEKLNDYYGFYNDKQYSYKIVPLLHVMNKVIKMQWSQKNIYVFTDIILDCEHD
ncbi:unnamed protein product, partial [Didymodactylos carnosus]